MYTTARIPVATLLLAFTGALASCNGADSSGDSPAESTAESTAVDQAALADIAGDLEEGSYELSVSGAWESVGEYSGGGDAAHYRPASDGSNHRGPHLFRLRTDVENEAGERAPAEALVVLPDGITPGSYELVPADDPEEGEVTARFRSMEVPFTFGGLSAEVDGTLELAEVGERLTARVTYTAWDRDDESVTVEGRTHALPFDFLPEGSFRVSGDRTEEYEGSVRVDAHGTRDIHIVTVGNHLDDDAFSFSFDFPNEVESGTYPLASEPGADGVYVNVHGPGDANGEIRVRRDGDTLQADFDFTVEGDGSVEVSGAFEHASFSG